MKDGGSQEGSRRRADWAVATAATASVQCGRLAWLARHGLMVGTHGVWAGAGTGVRPGSSVLVCEKRSACSRSNIMAVEALVVTLRLNT